MRQVLSLKRPTWNCHQPSKLRKRLPFDLNSRKLASKHHIFLSEDITVLTLYNTTFYVHQKKHCCVASSNSLSFFLQKSPNPPRLASVKVELKIIFFAPLPSCRHSFVGGKLNYYTLSSAPRPRGHVFTAWRCLVALWVGLGGSGRGDPHASY